MRTTVNVYATEVKRKYICKICTLFHNKFWSVVKACFSESNKIKCDLNSTVTYFLEYAVIIMEIIRVSITFDQ